eukprot:m51a1_g10763 hypothetical protein (400) ;mRNA; f:14859-16058
MQQQQEQQQQEAEVVWEGEATERRYGAFRGSGGALYRVGEYVLARLPPAEALQPARLVALREACATGGRVATLERVYRAADVGLALPPAYVVSAPGDTLDVPARCVAAHCDVVPASAALSPAASAGALVLSGLCYHAPSSSFWRTGPLQLQQQLHHQPPQQLQQQQPLQQLQQLQPPLKRPRSAAPASLAGPPAPPAPSALAALPGPPAAAAARARVSLPPLSLAIAVDDTAEAMPPMPLSLPLAPRSLRSATAPAPAPSSTPTPTPMRAHSAQGSPVAVPPSPPALPPPAYEMLPLPTQLQLQQHQQQLQQLQLQQLQLQRQQRQAHEAAHRQQQQGVTVPLLAGPSSGVHPPKPVRVPPPVAPGTRSKGRPVKYKFNPALLGGSLSDIATLMEPPRI